MHTRFHAGYEKSSTAAKMLYPLLFAKFQSTSRPGYPADPSYNINVAPASMDATEKFHIIQPVVEYQKNFSPCFTSQCSSSTFICSIRLPPTPCVMAFGLPVVPDEYSIHNGWSKCKRLKNDRAMLPSHSIGPMQQYPCITDVLAA